MTLTDRIWEFPTVAIEKQLFYVPGASVEGGFTAGGARITSPEPGGRSILQLQIALQITEWDFPFTSWLSSKTNGQIFRVRLAPTPQVLGARGLSDVPWDNNGPWDNGANWAGDMVAMYGADALEGSATVYIDMSAYGPILRHGHVIGHMNNCYAVDDITYDDNNIATVTVTPPLRKNVTVGDIVFFRPWFLGTIGNGANFITTYDAGNNGLIQPGAITFNEAVV